MPHKLPGPCRGEPGCDQLGTIRGRCQDCAARHEKARGTKQQRGYTARHDKERRKWAPLVATGTIDCVRCGQRIPRGAPWDLGHNDERTAWTGPEHAKCNRAAGGRSAHLLKPEGT